MQGEPVHEVAGGLPCLGRRSPGWPAECGTTGDWAAADGAPASHVLFVGEVVDAGERVRADRDGDQPGILRMEDTRMNYGG